MMSVTTHQLLMSFKRENMIICPDPIFGLGLNLSHFGNCLLGSTHFLQSFWGYGSNRKMSVCTEVYTIPTENQDKNR